MALSIHTSELLAQHIEQRVRSAGLSYMDAVIEFCDQRQIEPETIVPLISDRIKSEINTEAQRLHLIPKTANLYE